MNKNYLFNSTGATRRHLISMVFLLLAGTTAFTIIAAMLSYLELEQSFIIGLSAFGAIVIDILIANRIHSNDFGILNLSMWPINTQTQAVNQTKKITDLYRKLIKQAERIQRETEKMLVDNIELRKSAQALRNADLVNKNAKNYTRILGIRAKVKELHASLVTQIAISEALTAKVASTSAYKELLLMSFSPSSQVKSHQSQVNKLQRDKKTIQSGQHAIINQLSK